MDPITGRHLVAVAQASCFDLTDHPDSVVLLWRWCDETDHPDSVVLLWRWCDLHSSGWIPCKASAQRPFGVEANAVAWTEWTCETVQGCDWDKHRDLKRWLVNGIGMVGWGEHRVSIRKNYSWGRPRVQCNTIQLYCQVSVQLHLEFFVVLSTLITHSHQSSRQNNYSWRKHRVQGYISAEGDKSCLRNTKYLFIRINGHLFVCCFSTIQFYC